MIGLSPGPFRLLWGSIRRVRGSRGPLEGLERSETQQKADKLQSRPTLGQCGEFDRRHSFNRIRGAASTSSLPLLPSLLQQHLFGSTSTSSAAKMRALGWIALCLLAGTCFALDPYKALGVGRTADERDIKKAYRVRTCS